ncbi:MAG: hypothetical protein HOE64_17150 [Nitrospina sp.]|jgi:hypothetical protein|nr:hypothetical protein [Nitrospina sp.]
MSVYYAPFNDKKEAMDAGYSPVPDKKTPMFWVEENSPQWEYLQKKDSYGRNK